MARIQRESDGGYAMRVAVIGASGYTGLELLRILLRHNPAVPKDSISYATSFPSLVAASLTF